MTDTWVSLIRGVGRDSGVFEPENGRRSTRRRADVALDRNPAG